MVTNSVDVARTAAAIPRARLAVVDVAPLLAEAIRRLHEHGSLVELQGDR
jgi:phosphoribosylpyrophosphate synthetase